MRLNSALKKIGSALAIGVLVLFPCHPTWALENPFKPVCDRSIEIRNYFEKSLGKKCSEIKASNLKWDFKQETLLITEVETIRTGDLSGIEASSIEIRSSKLREIEADSFHGSSIQNLIISNSAPTMKTINNKALRGLECFSFYINNTSIETIKNETFGVELLGYNKSIASIQIKNNINLKTIEDGAFGVKPIGQIHLANNPLWKLQKNLFNNVGPIGSIIIENNSNILEIEPGTFKGSISAVKLNGNKSLKILRKGTFQPTTDLSIGIDNNVEIIEPGAFKGDESVKIFLYIHSDYHRKYLPTGLFSDVFFGGISLDNTVIEEIQEGALRTKSGKLDYIKLEYNTKLVKIGDQFEPNDSVGSLLIYYNDKLNLSGSTFSNITIDSVKILESPNLIIGQRAFNNSKISNLDIMYDTLLNSVSEDEKISPFLNTLISDMISIYNAKIPFPPRFFANLGIKKINILNLNAQGIKYVPYYAFSPDYLGLESEIEELLLIGNPLYDVEEGAFKHVKKVHFW